MEDLIAFLRARLDEDEQIARAPHPAFLAWEYDASVWQIRDLGNGNELANVLPRRAYGEHIARHDPARVLAEVDAKRELLSCYEAMAADVLVVTGVESILSEYRRVILPGLALPYADHPDYQDAWRS
ncbi:DUF6221 family protein [Streptomyces sp. NPDC059534]|uniref:DUF6221 family protein n=1 Tax=Streptomyces sp. NPDC059534 TaxID=3346859 RepID=UPI0036B0C2BD